ncbi:MAG: hypothetical protein ACYCZO_13690 [Daejeonella sp.]
MIDLNEQAEFKELFKNEDQDVLDKSVFLKLAMDLEVRWPDTSRIIEFKLYSDFYQQGIVNDLNDVSAV